jgi:four helix bundle protein
MSGAERFDDLISWQRMNELSIEVWKITNRPPAPKDFDFRNEIRDASDSAQRNIAEGFGRYSPPQFAQFLDISRASALETKALLKKGLAVGYWTEDEFQRLNKLADRGLQAVAKFQRYLRSPQAKRNAARRYRRQRDGQNVPNGKNEPNGSNDPNDSNDPNVTNEPNDPNDPNDRR